MQWLSRIAVRRPVFASVLMLLIVVIGLVGYRSLGVDKFPKINFPMVVITTAYPGASPSAVEKDVSEKIEEAVNSVSGIEVLSSQSSEGVSLVVVQFSLDRSRDIAAQEVRDRISGIQGNLPVGVRQPQIQLADPDAAPILMLSVKGPQSVRDLTEVADVIVKRRLEGLPGIGQILIIGGQKRRIEVEVDPVRLRAAGVSALEVQRAIAVSNVSLPGGRIDQGPGFSSLRLEGRVARPEQLADIVVRQQGDHPIKVGDVATVKDTVVDPDSTALRDGEAAVVLAVRKQSGTNTVGVVDAATAAVNEIRSSLPPGVRLEVVRDNSETIRTNVDAVQEHLWLGALLAALVVLVFLGSLRSTVIAAIAIPISIIGSFALMSYAGFTMNNMTLLALALAVGIVIDDAIVVNENIHRYIHEKGMKPFPAAVQATKEIGLAVLATSLSLCAVFLPVAFMGGIVGRFLASFGLTMAFAILVSLVVAFTITPMLSARLLPPPPPAGEAEKRTILERLVDRWYKPVERGYMALLRVSLTRHGRWVVIGLCVGAVMMVPVLGKQAGFGFIPDSDEANFELFIKTPEGTSLDSTAILTERLARQTRRIPEVTHTLVTLGDTDQKVTNVGKVYVRLTNPDARRRTQNEIMDEVRRTVLVNLPPGTIAAAQIVNDFSLGANQNAMITYVVTGPDLEKLEALGRKALAELKQVPGVADPDVSVSEPTPESTLRPNLDRAAALGVDPADVASSLRLLIAGVETSKYEEKGEQYDVFVRAAERYRTDPSILGVITVPSRTLGHVPLSDVVTLETGVGPAKINRLGRTRQVTISCNVAPGGDEGAIVAKLEKIIDDLDLPPGYASAPFGRSREMARMGPAFIFAFLMSFVFMYLVLAAQFESWLHPLIIMLALPLTLPFAFLSVVLFGQQLNIFSMLGLLVLFGVVKKNAILQIDHTNQLRAKGVPRHQALLDANRDRLRPILMTTFAFVAGMLPLVFSQGIGAGFSKAMAGIVVGGQTLSLLLTLIAIPVIYSLFDDAKGFVGRVRTRVFGGVKVDRGAEELSSAA